MTPAQAEDFDDATCGLIAEYVMDLAYDMGAPMEQQPQGENRADEAGCLMTHVLVNPQGPAGLMVEQVTWTGEGVADWVAGNGWPSKLEVGVEGAYLWNAIPNYPAMEWANRIAARRNAISGGIELIWDKKSGLLSLELLEAGAGYNWVRLSGLASGIYEGNYQQSLPTVRLHDVQADLTFDGMFETIVLTPFAVGLLGGKDDPAAAFEEWRTLVQSYLTALPAPQVDVISVLNIGDFVDALPSPTGRLLVKLKADSGVHLVSAVPLVAQMGTPTPEGASILVEGLLGPARLTVNWTPGRVR